MTSVEERHVYNDQSYWTGTTQKKNDMTEPKDGGKFTVKQKQGQLELQDTVGIVERHRYNHQRYWTGRRWKKNDMMGLKDGETLR